jgi:hypothetical protein
MALYDALGAGWHTTRSYWASRIMQPRAELMHNRCKSDRAGPLAGDADVAKPVYAADFDKKLECALFKETGAAEPLKFGERLRTRKVPANPEPSLHARKV